MLDAMHLLVETTDFVASLVNGATKLYISHMIFTNPVFF